MKDKLHEKLIAMGDLEGKRFEDFTAACGEPKEVRDFTFSDIGPGRRATWSDGLFTVTMNFSADGEFHGVDKATHKGPWITIIAVTVIIIAAIFIGSAFLRAHNASEPSAAAIGWAESAGALYDT